MTPSDDELIRLMASGVEEAFATLYCWYQGRVFRFALFR